jgi:uncharacterized surface protein with fasciclin (FAS1) repeats
LEKGELTVENDSDGLMNFNGKKFNGKKIRIENNVIYVDDKVTDKIN